MIIDRIVKTFEDVVCILSLATIVLLVLVQVFFRYVLSSGILWIDEMVTNLMVLLVLVGAALATRHDMHTDLRMLLDVAPGPIRRVLRAICVVATLGFLTALIYASASYAYDARRLSTTMIGIPLWLAYGIIPFGGVLILYEYLKKLIGSARSGRTGETAPW